MFDPFPKTKCFTHFRENKKQIYVWPIFENEKRIYVFEKKNTQGGFDVFFDIFALVIVRQHNPIVSHLLSVNGLNLQR